MFIYKNPNPEKNLVGDCVIRAISIALGESWDYVYDEITNQGRIMHDMPSSNEVWHEYLLINGFERYIIQDSCPACYTVRDFCRDNPIGMFILATGSHVVTVIDGDHYDTWDSGREIPIYYFLRR